MQRFAWNFSHQLISADNAPKGADFICPLCRSALRVKRGDERIAHFFHLKKSLCAQESKSLEHLYIQERIAEKFPHSSEIEKPFPAIGRIADVAILDKKLIFEVQCSSISSEEVKSRVRDYRSLGWHVVFILHDHKFNKGWASPGELAMRRGASFFTNISQEGLGIFYDQKEIFKGRKRTFKGERLEVDLSKITPSFQKSIELGPKWTLKGVMEKLLSRLVKKYL